MLHKINCRARFPPKSYKRRDVVEVFMSIFKKFFKNFIKDAYMLSIAITKTPKSSVVSKEIFSQGRIRVVFRVYPLLTSHLGIFFSRTY